MMAVFYAAAQAEARRSTLLAHNTERNQRQHQPQQEEEEEEDRWMAEIPRVLELREKEWRRWRGGRRERMNRGGGTLRRGGGFIECRTPASREFAATREMSE